MTPFIRDDFAGPGGWSEGLRRLGLEETVGIEFDQTAADTARAAGHVRWIIDVTSPDVRTYAWPRMWLYLASPPCQTFAQAGNGAGRAHMDALIRAAKMVAAGTPPAVAVKTVADEALDERSVLVLEPLHVIATHRPDNVALEQVPTVLPIWDAYAELMRGMGYSVWAGVLNAEQYGVPQARRRAVLMASRNRDVAPPAPTHSQYHRHAPERLDDGVKPWITMEAALARPAIPAVAGDTSWTTRRPSPTIVGSFRPDIVAAPGYRRPGDGPRQKQPGSVKIEPWEGGVLQSFPSTYPWQGSEAKKWEQVGNAIPPRLAAAIVAALVGSA